MSRQMVDPPFQTQLAHDGVDPGKPSTAELPALEPVLSLLTINIVLARYETALWVHVTAEMPWYESAVGVSYCLPKHPTKLSLCTKIHVSEEKLSSQADRWL